MRSKRRMLTIPIRAIEEEPLRLLLIEDDPVHVELIRAFLEDVRGSRYDVQVVETVGAAVERVVAEPFDALLVDYRLPDGSGLDLIREVREAGYAGAAILLTAESAPSLDANALLVGANDFVEKGTFGSKELARTLRFTVQQARTLAALQDSEERLRQIAEAVPEVFWMIDANDYSVIYVSAAAQRVWGVPEDDVATLDDFLGRIVEEDRETFRELLSQARQGDAAAELRCQRPDGAIRWIRCRVAPVTDAAGTLVRLAGVDEDRTAERALDEASTRARKMEAVARLSGALAHDFNNLLTVIQGYAELLRDGLADDEQRADVDTILEAAGRAGRLTRRLVTFSRRRPNQPVAVDLNRAIRGVLPALTERLGDGVRLDVRLGEGVGAVRADPGQLDEALLALADNARDAMDGSGLLTVTTERAHVGAAGAARNPGLSPGDYLVISVRDTGVGMDEATRGRIFEPYFTTKGGRDTGLSLTNVYASIAQAGGFITVDSAEGEGACFRLYLSEAADAPDESAEAPAAAAAVVPSTILVVDDEPQVLHLARTFLERAGHRVFAVDRPAEALELVRRTPGAFDLLLTDVLMPGMTGRELVDEITQLAPSMPVLYMTGYAADAFEGAAERPGAAEVLEKPFSRDGLLERVGATLARRAGSGA